MHVDLFVDDNNNKKNNNSNVIITIIFNTTIVKNVMAKTKFNNKWLKCRTRPRPVERGVGERGKVFPAPRRSGAPPSLKNTEKCVTGGFVLTSNMHKIHFRPEPRIPLMKLPQTPSRMVRGHPSPCFLPLDAFGISISANTSMRL